MDTLFLVASKIVEMKYIYQVYIGFGKYILNCLLGHTICRLLAMPLIYFIFTGKNP